MPKNYGTEPASPASNYGGPSAHGLGGHYSVAEGPSGAAGGGEYTNQRGSQGAAGGGDYTWQQGPSGHSPGGGDYSWAKAESGTDPRGDEFKTGMAPVEGGLDIDPGPSMTTQPDPYNPYQNGMI